MTKQKLEGYLSKSLRAKPNLWHMKLQVMPLAHQQTPADFLALTKANNYLIECKQVTCKQVNCKQTKSEKWNGAFAFTRLTQKHDLYSFFKFAKHNFSYVNLMYWKGSLKLSDTYLIPITRFSYEMKMTSKKSFNVNDAKQLFSIYKLQVEKGSIFNLADIV
jgi:hypothetical protein